MQRLRNCFVQLCLAALVAAAAAGCSSIEEMGPARDYSSKLGDEVTKYPIHGIDVSKYQGAIDWQRRGQERRALRLDQGDGGRRPKGRPVRGELERRASRRDSDRRLSFLLFLQAGRRPDRLVQDACAAGARCAAAGSGHGVEPPVADLQAASAAGEGEGRHGALPGGRWRRSTASARSSTRPSTSIATCCMATCSATTSSGCARSPAILRPSMATGAGRSGSIPRPAPFPASAARSTATSSPATRRNGGSSSPTEPMSRVRRRRPSPAAAETRRGARVCRHRRPRLPKRPSTRPASEVAPAGPARPRSMSPPPRPQPAAAGGGPVTPVSLADIY